MVTLGEMYGFHVPTICGICKKELGYHTIEEFQACMDLAKIGTVMASFK